MPRGWESHVALSLSLFNGTICCCKVDKKTSYLCNDNDHIKKWMCKQSTGLKIFFSCIQHQSLQGCGFWFCLHLNSFSFLDSSLLVLLFLLLSHFWEGGYLLPSLTVDSGLRNSLGSSDRILQLSRFSFSIALVCLQSLMFLKKWNRSLILDLWSLRCGYISNLFVWIFIQLRNVHVIFCCS